MSKQVPNDKITVMDSNSAPMEENEPLKGEMDELKREMRSAQLTHWMLSHQKQLMGAVVALVLALMAGGMWMEHNKDHRAAAATLYQQAMNAQDADKKITLMQSVRTEFGSSSYAALALMELARLDAAHAETYLNALMKHPKAMQEWVWQARLDLATIKLEAGDKAAATALLSKVVGSQYQQQRHYLMAMAATDAADKEKHLKQALDAISKDDALKRKIESMLSSRLS